MYSGSLTDIKGLAIGHYSNHDARTGCTVVLCREGAIAGVDVRGSAPGTRETDLLRPGQLIDRIHSIVLSGGSAFGLEAACGVMEFLEEKEIGFNTGNAIIPIVCSAVIYDLDVGRSDIRPNKFMGRRAAELASIIQHSQGLIGAGTGASVGKIFGPKYAENGGIGMASITLPGGVCVAAMIVVNAFGDVINLTDGSIMAGARNPINGKYIRTAEYLLKSVDAKAAFTKHTNTTIGVVATNARLDKGQVNKLASVAHDGLALTIRPVHTMLDGDTIFALSCGDCVTDMTLLCNAAVEVTARAINNAITATKELAYDSGDRN